MAEGAPIKRERKRQAMRRYLDRQRRLGRVHRQSLTSEEWAAVQRMRQAASVGPMTKAEAGKIGGPASVAARRMTVEQLRQEIEQRRAVLDQERVQRRAELAEVHKQRSEERKRERQAEREPRRLKRESKRLQVKIEKERLTHDELMQRLGVAARKQWSDEVAQMPKVGGHNTR